VDLRRTIVNEFESEEECNMFIMVLEKNLPLAKDVIGSAKVEIMKSDQSPKIMSVTWAFEKPEDILILDRFSEKYILPYRKKLAPKTTTYTGAVVARIEF
jgi:hypothetical protein